MESGVKLHEVRGEELGNRDGGKRLPRENG